MWGEGGEAGKYFSPKVVGCREKGGAVMEGRRDQHSLCTTAREGPESQNDGKEKTRKHYC